MHGTLRADLPLFLSDELVLILGLIRYKICKVWRQLAVIQIQGVKIGKINKYTELPKMENVSSNFNYKDLLFNAQIH